MNNKIKLLEFDNQYWKKDPEKFLELQELVKSYPRHYNKLLQFPKNNKQYLMQYINECIPKVHKGLELSLNTRIFWLFNGMNDFPLCHECNKSIVKNVKNIRFGYRHHIDSNFLFCSKECHYKNEDVLKLGGMHQKETFKDPVKHQNIIDQRAKTLSEHYGKSVTLHDLATKAIMQKYGVNSAFKIPEVRQKIGDTCEKKYGKGIRNPFGAKLIKEQLKKTYLKNLGVEYVSQNPEVKKKIRETTIKNNGTLVVSHKYNYDGKSFDSGWEICYYIWLKDHIIDFNYPAGISFEYEHEGKIHHYYPDFLVEGIPVEIKGKQFLDDNGEMSFPFKEGISKEERNLRDKLGKKKYQCMLQNNVKLLSQEEINPYLKYVQQKFKVKSYMDFCRQFRKSK